MDHNQKTQTETEAVAALVKTANTPALNVDPFGLAVFSNGTVINLAKEELLDHPKRKRANVRLIETSSFIDYVAAHQSAAATHVFGVATEDGGKFFAFIDWHERSSTAPQGAEVHANWGEHTVQLELATSPEWRRWLAANGKLMTQEAFAEFLEDNLTDIVRPDAAFLIDVAQLLQGKKTAHFKSGKNLQNGAVQLEYSEAIETSGGRVNGDFQVPSEFFIGLCPFVGAAGVEMRARLRFRIAEGGKLHFAYILDRPYKIIETAFMLAREEIEQKLSLKVHLGNAMVGPVNDPTVRRC